MQSRALSFTALVITAAAAAACTVPASTDSDPVGSEAQRIQSGTPAQSYPEAVLIDAAQGGVTQPGCAGALIGPRAVLTSGRCATQLDAWTVRAPFAAGEARQGVSSAVYDFDHTADTPSTDEHDVGIVFLDAPIVLTAYPELATEPLVDGDQVVAVGRLLDGQASSSTTYVSQPIEVHAADGFPYDYATTGVIEHGDAGGPDFLPGTHTLVAVNAGSVDGTSLLARVDLVNAWIQEQLATSEGGVGNPGWPQGPGGPGWPQGPGGPGDGHGGGHGGGQGNGHGGGQGNGHGGGQGNGHGGGR